MPLTGAPEVQDGLLERDLGGRHQDEEADPVEGAQVQVLSAGVCDGTDVGQQLPGHRQLDGSHLAPLHRVFCTHTVTDSVENQGFTAAQSRSGQALKSL